MKTVTTIGAMALVTGLVGGACGGNPSGAVGGGGGSAGAASSGRSEVGSAGGAHPATTGAGASGNPTTGSASSPASVVPIDGGGQTPDAFWGDTATIPVAKNVMTFKFLNRTNGVIPDSRLYWSFQHTDPANAANNIDELHSIADKPTYDMPANASGRMYFFVVTSPADPPTSATAPRTSKYYDFIEHTIGAAQYNGNTTRVDAFGLKIAMRLHCQDGYDAAVGEDYPTFLESREATFARFIAEVPPEFAHLAQAPFAPYRIVEPGAGNFKTGGSQEHYYDSWVNALWAANAITVAKPGANCNPISDPNLSASCYRHVGSGELQPNGALQKGSTLWADAAAFYKTAPANYYAKFWHTHGINGKAYGFPYDDVGGYSSYVSHQNPSYMIVAIGW